VSTSIYAHEINRALQLAKNAKSTREIVTIAENLYDELFPVSEEGESEEGESGDKPPIEGDFPVPSDEPPKGDSEGGEGDPDEGDGEGETKDGEGEGKGKDGEPTEPPKDPLKDDGTAPLDVEPNEFIKRSLREFDCRADRRGYGRPTVKSIEVIEINDWS
jgi:hypothetical protein